MLFSQFLLKWLSLKAARFLHNSMLRQLLRRADTLASPTCLLTVE